MPINLARAIGVGFIVVCFPVKAWSEPRATEIRVQISGGWSTSVGNLTTNEEVEDIDIAVTMGSIGTGDGPTFGASIWVDRWIAPNWSLGVGYVRSTFEPEITTSSVVLGTPIGLQTTNEIKLNTGFFNIAWRPSSGEVHPFLGVGLGVGYMDIELNGLVFGGSGQADTSGDFDTVHAGGQVFFGFDHDISETIYLGVLGRVYHVDGRIVGEDVQFTEYALQGTIGVRF